MATSMVSSSSSSLKTQTAVSHKALYKVNQLWKTSPALTLCGLVALLALAGSAIGLLLDPTVITGVPAWVKPAKFSISLSLYSFTLVWLLGFIQGHPRLVKIAALTTALTTTLELAAVALQTARHTTSHFNLSSPFDSFVFELMGLTVFFLFSACLLVAVLMLFQRLPDPTLAWAIRLGLVLTCVGMALAGLMLLPTPEQSAALAAGLKPAIIGGHSVGVVDGGPGLPFLGWSTQGGDLRIPHFFGLHALQLLPLVGGLISKLALAKKHQLALVWTFGVGYLAFILLVTWQALRGQSIVAPDTLSLAAFGTLAGGMVLVTTLILVTGRVPQLQAN